MKSLLFILGSIFQLTGFAQKGDDTAAVYQAVLETLFMDNKVIASTAGYVPYADIYGNYKEMRCRGDSAMEAQGKIYVMWVEPEKYPTSVATVLKRHGIAFDTIEVKDVVWARPKDLQKLVPTYNFLKVKKAPLGYSFFDNIFKEKQAIQLSELLFMKGLDVAIGKAKVEKRSNKGEWEEMIVLHKENNKWKVLERIKSSR